MVKEMHETRDCLSLDINEGIRDLEISADERKLKQILFNLLSNAVKFTPEGGTIK
jgi:signal transduction histidine kinase